MPNGWRLTHVRLGEWDTSSSQDCEFQNGRQICSTPAIDIPVYEPIVHEHFNSENLHNDIALIRLKQDVIFNQFIYPICLPVAANLRNLDFYNELLFVAGWGRTEDMVAKHLCLEICYLIP